MLKRIIFVFLLLVFTVKGFAIYYEANADIAPYLNDITDKFVTIDSYVKRGDYNISSSVFSNLERDFSILKTKLPQDPKFRVVYETCEKISADLASEITNSKIDTFYSQCFGPWKQVSRQIFLQYTVKAVAKASPNSGNAPLTVTFDGKKSVDPSGDTIPNNNYYWYYKDNRGIQHLIGQGPYINYTFNEPNSYKVHLAVKSVNKQSQGILDGEDTVTVDVLPPIANIVLYINGQKADIYSYVKVSKAEGERGILFDASGTTPNGKTKIEKSIWTISKGNKLIYKKEVYGYPGLIRVKLPENGVYFVNVTIIDNVKNKVSKTFKLVVSNPVALIKVIPKVGNTSTNFTIDGSSSYSINGQIKKYKWTIIGPNGNVIDSFEGKKTFKHKFIVPGYYSIKLEIADVNGNVNDESYKLKVDSTPPVASFVFDKFDNWEKPSTFVFDASYSQDVDIKNGDSLSYIWSFSNSQNVKVQKINNGKKIIAQFNKKGVYKVTLTVKDKYGKTDTVSKDVKVLSALRPEVSINPNYTVINTPITIKLKANKPVSYYEVYFGDGDKNDKIQQNVISHTYEKAGVFDLKVVAYSVDGDSNTITKKVFIGQRGYPIAVYNVYVGENQQLQSDTCKIKGKKGKYKYVPAYKIDRGQSFTVSAKDSVNAQGTHNLLKIYFQKDNEKEYINKTQAIFKFSELGCRKITVYVRDLNTNKIDKKDIYFKVKNAKPILRDLKMYFPQYQGNQNGVFRPDVGNNVVAKDIFSAGFDPLLVKLVVIGASDKDSSILSYYRWYYYRKGDKENPVKVKMTPANIPEVVFSVPKIPGEYIFGVDVCDVDGGCTSSEDYLNLKPVVNIPKSAENPNYPQINSVRVDANGDKGVSQVNVGEEVKIVVNSSLPSNKSDFKSTRVFKYDFDNDGKWDLITKKSTVKYVFKKPYSKHRVKAIVLYRGNASNPGYSDYFEVIKGLKALVDINYLGQDLIYNDMSLGNIKSKKLCFDLKKCLKKNSKYFVTKDNYGHIFYNTTGTKLLIFKISDNYGNKSIQKEKITIKPTKNTNFLLTLPKQIEEKDGYVVHVAGSYTNYFVLYYKSDSKNCYIDKNIAVDSDGDGNSANDKDLSCNRTYKLVYESIPEVILQINDDGKTKKIKVIFDNLQLDIPEKFKQAYSDILSIVDKYADSDDEDIQGLRTFLVSLMQSIDDRLERDEYITQIQYWLANNPGLLDEDDELKLKSVLDTLSDKAVKVLSNPNALDNLSTDLQMYLDENKEGKKVFELLNELSNTTDKEKRKDILEKIYKNIASLQKQGVIQLDEFQDIKKDICLVMQDYQIQSKACGFKEKDNIVAENTSGTSTLGKILKIIGYFAIAFLLIFVIIIIIFVIKAKRKREEEDDDE